MEESAGQGKRVDARTRLMIGDRGIKLHAKLPPTVDQTQYVSEQQVGEWKKQVELLQGCDEKSLFKDVEVEKRVI